MATQDDDSARPLGSNSRFFAMVALSSAAMLIVISSFAFLVWEQQKIKAELKELRRDTEAIGKMIPPLNKLNAILNQQQPAKSQE